jgi:hypothetical protein
MKNVFTFTIAWGVSICSMVAVMQATGLGHPNCEPTAVGYAEFYATLFGCSVLSCTLGIGCLALLVFANRRINKQH